MRERCPDHALTVDHLAEGAAPRRALVHHRWEDSEAQ